VKARDDYPADGAIGGTAELRDGLYEKAMDEIDSLRLRPRRSYERGARRLVTEVWRLVDMRMLNARSMAADAALDLRDEIDPAWMPGTHEEDRCAPTIGISHVYPHELELACWHHGVIANLGMMPKAAEILRLLHEHHEKAT